MQYIIVGDTANYKGCLIYPCGKSKENAEKTLKRLLENPNDNDKYCMKGHTNIRIETTSDENCWWNDPFLAN